MYCLTYVNNFGCVLNELYLWSDISSEHPIFIKTVASLTNKNLPKDLLDKLSEITKVFSNLKIKSEELRKSMPYNYMNFNYMLQLRKLVDSFLVNDKYVFNVLDEVKKYDKDDKVWQTLLEHITHEQRFMYELFTKIRMQLTL